MTEGEYEFEIYFIYIQAFGRFSSLFSKFISLHLAQKKGKLVPIPN